jgi:phospholipase C
VPKARSKKSKGWSKKLTALLVFLGAIIIFAAAYISFGVTNNSSGGSPKIAVEAVSTSAVPNYDHIFIIMEENHGNEGIIGNPRAGYINAIARSGAFGSNYYAITHPSVPNYLYLTSGVNGGITDDCNPPSDSCDANVKNIADRIEASGRTWKAYMESMPSPCQLNSTDLYDNEHNPFIYYRDIRDKPLRCQAHDVPLTQLDEDLKSANATPNFAFISPNLCNDMHNCKENIEVGDEWLADWITKIMNSPAFYDQKSLIIVTYDEAEFEAAQNKVPIIMLGSGVKKNYSAATRYDHFSLLKTIESAWQLTPLSSNDRNATVMSEFFN